MKRILPLILTVLLLPTLLAVPARADDFNAYSYNLLDYAFPNDSDRYAVTVNDGDIVTFKQPIPSIIVFVDILFNNNGRIVSGIEIQHGTATATLTIEQVEGRLYRAYGSITASTDDDIKLVFSAPDTAYLTFIRFDVATQAISGGKLDVSASIRDYAVSDEYTHFFDYTGTSASVSWDNLQAYAANRSYRADLLISDYQPYDYVDLIVSTVSVGVTSISCTIGGLSGVTVPFSVNYIDSTGEYSNGLTLISIRIDLTEFQTNVYSLFVSITADEWSNGTTSFGIISCGGITSVTEISPWLVWFGRLDGWIKTQTSGITSAIAAWGQNIINALGGNNDASGVQDNINAAVGELQQAGAALDSVQRPDIGHVNIDVAGMIDPAGLSGVASIVGLFTGNTLIYTIMLMFLTLALISYIIFGKR